MAINIEDLKTNRKVIASFDYPVTPVNRGYTDKTLYVNVGTGEIKSKNVPAQMKEKFIGGKGYGLRLLWDAITPNTKWNDPENEILISGGPICGITQYSGAGKSLVVTLSPQTHIPVDSNVGGFFGPFLKIAGFDALEVQGKSDKDVVVYIDAAKGHVEIFEDPGFEHDSHMLAEELTDLFANDDKDKKNIGIVSAGDAADHSLIGMLNFTFYDSKRKKIRLKQADSR